MNNQKNAERNHEAGFTLVDVIIGLVIGLFILAAVGKMSGKGFSASKLAETEQNLLVMRSEIQGLFSGSTDYSGLDNALVIKAGIAPKSFIKGANLVNAWGGAVTIASNSVDATWSIAFTLIPQEECTKLATFQPEAWLLVDVNGTTIEGGDVTSVTASCSTSNTITFTTR